jgi:putative transposase
MNQISEIHADFPYYGYRKIHAHLKQNYEYIGNKKKIQRLMQLMNIKAVYQGPKTSIPSSDGSVFPYLLKGLVINKANQVWAVDITYIKLPVGTVYLFALIDWHSRFIVSYKLINTMEAIHAIEVIEDAMLKYGKPEICNSDQGSQFTGNLWIQKLNENSIKISHDGAGRCIDNIRIERFWRSLKYEDIFIRSYDTMQEARCGINKYIKHYNYQRPHQALGYKVPADIYFD